MQLGIIAEPTKESFIMAQSKKNYHLLNFVLTLTRM